MLALSLFAAPGLGVAQSAQSVAASLVSLPFGDRQSEPGRRRVFLGRRRALDEAHGPEVRDHGAVIDPPYESASESVSVAVLTSAIPSGIAVLDVVRCGGERDERRPDAGTTVALPMTA